MNHSKNFMKTVSHSSEMLSAPAPKLKACMAWHRVHSKQFSCLSCIHSINGRLTATMLNKKNVYLSLINCGLMGKKSPTGNQ